VINVKDYNNQARLKMLYEAGEITNSSALLYWICASSNDYRALL